MSIVKKLGNKRVTKKILWLLLACFAGNANANAINANVRGQIDNLITRNRALNYQSIRTIIDLLQI